MTRAAVKIAVAVTAWMLAGAIFGSVLAVINATFNCAPVRVWKPDLTFIIGVIMTLEFALFAIPLGVVMAIVLKNDAGNYRGFAFHFVASLGVAFVLLSFFAILAYASPAAYNCAPP